MFSRWNIIMCVFESFFGRRIQRLLPFELFSTMGLHEKMSGPAWHPDHLLHIDISTNLANAPSNQISLNGQRVKGMSQQTISWHEKGCSWNWRRNVLVHETMG